MNDDFKFTLEIRTETGALSLVPGMRIFDIRARPRWKRERTTHSFGFLSRV